jgi:hypothetical protein
MAPTTDLGDAVLQVEEVCHGTFVPLRPKMVSGRSVDQLSSEANAVTCLAHASHDQIAGLYAGRYGTAQARRRGAAHRPEAPRWQPDRQPGHRREGRGEAADVTPRRLRRRSETGRSNPNAHLRFGCRRRRTCRLAGAAQTPPATTPVRARAQQASRATDATAGGQFADLGSGARCSPGASLCWKTRLSGFSRSRSMANKDVDAVTIEVALDDHIAEIDADAQFDAVVRRDAGVPLRHRLLHRDRAAHRISTTLASSTSMPSPVVY